MRLYCPSMAVLLPLFFSMFFSGMVSANNTDPIHVTNSLPVMHGSGLSAPKSAYLSKSEVGRDWSFLILGNLQSHANDAGSGSESLILDGEVHQLGLVSEWHFAPRWQLGLELGLIKNTGGNLDNVIREWHDIFGLTQGDRETLEDDQFLYTYSNEQTLGLGDVLLTDSTSSLGDTELSIGYQLYAVHNFYIAGHLSALLPTGNASKVTGSDKTDFKLSVALGANTSRRLAWHLNAEFISIGDDELFNIPTQSSTWATSVGLHWRTNERWRWSAQLDGHGEVFKSEIDEINKPAWQLALAGQYGKHWQVYIAEDLSVNRAADFSFGLNWISAY